MTFAIPTLMRPLRAAVLPLVAALVLAGCASVPSGMPTVPTAAQFKEQPGATAPAGFTRATPAEAQPRGEWWLAFNDPVLNTLIQRVLRLRRTGTTAGATGLVTVAGSS